MRSSLPSCAVAGELADDAVSVAGHRTFEDFIAPTLQALSA
jgi:hypothetical protein